MGPKHTVSRAKFFLSFCQI